MLLTIYSNLLHDNGIGIIKKLISISGRLIIHKVGKWYDLAVTVMVL